MPLTIEASFPLGVFQGNEVSGLPTRHPSLSRLFSALTHAAGTGSTALEVAADLQPSPESVAALLWLETNPPQQLRIPETTEVRDTGDTRHDHPISYRDKGVKKKGVPKKTAHPLECATAVAGAYVWYWTGDVPPTVASQLIRLCEDVGCLGENHSPVVLSATVDRPKNLNPTHRLAAHQWGSPDNKQQLTVKAPMQGRFRVLEGAYLKTQSPKKQPADTEPNEVEPHVAATTDRQLFDLHYDPVVPAEPDVPWPTAWFVHCQMPVSLKNRVKAAVALHRALCAMLHDGAPSLVTGKYPDGVRPPSNRVAVHYLDAQTAALTALPGAGFVVLAPRGARSADVHQLDEALKHLKDVFFPGARGEVTAVEKVDPVTLWRPAMPGTVRVWQPIPALVPETRPQQRAGGKPWTLVDAACLSLAYVFRDRINPDLPPKPSRHQLVAAVKDKVTVVGARKLADSAASRYAHKTPTGLVVEPYTALLELSSLLPDTACVAVGQSRHLGGGFLVPVDLPSTAWVALKEASVR